MMAIMVTIMIADNRAGNQEDSEESISRADSQPLISRQSVLLSSRLLMSYLRTSKVASLFMSSLKRRPLINNNNADVRAYVHSVTQLTQCTCAANKQELTRKSCPFFLAHNRTEGLKAIDQDQDHP